MLLVDDNNVREAKLVELFDLLDHDHSGEIDANEMRLLGLAITGAKELPSLDETKDQLRRADCDRNTRINLAEWVAFGKATSLFSLDLTEFLITMDTYADRIHRHYDDGGHLRPTKPQGQPVPVRHKFPPLLSSKSKRFVRRPLIGNSTDESERSPPSHSITPSHTTKPTASNWFWGSCSECALPGRISCSDCNILLCLSHGASHAVTHLHPPSTLSNQQDASLGQQGLGGTNSGDKSTTSLQLKPIPRITNRKTESCRVM